MDGDCTLMSPLADYQENPNPTLSTFGLWSKIREWLANNWYKVLSLALSAVIALHWIKTDAIPFILNWFKQ